MREAEADGTLWHTRGDVVITAVLSAAYEFEKDGFPRLPLNPVAVTQVRGTVQAWAGKELTLCPGQSDFSSGHVRLRWAFGW